MTVRRADASVDESSSVDLSGEKVRKMTFRRKGGRSVKLLVVELPLMVTQGSGEIEELISNEEVLGGGGGEGGEEYGNEEMKGGE